MNDGLAELEEHRQPQHTGFCSFHVSDTRARDAWTKILVVRN